ncbi:hypothetical protein KIL84_006676 [Mauremys mutica]|uniref:Uncharacterized protein n=1 Tax=Mauremys mutica TaxID=74926 RepID=A0A9D4AUB6_9SAUR|nr:hypothetical protein KIL84_006676 [Mauremys mutica]
MAPMRGQGWAVPRDHQGTATHRTKWPRADMKECGRRPKGGTREQGNEQQSLRPSSGPSHPRPEGGSSHLLIPHSEPQAQGGQLQPSHPRPGARLPPSPPKSKP